MATKQKQTKAFSIETKWSVILMESDDQSDQAQHPAFFRYAGG